MKGKNQVSSYGRKSRERLQLVDSKLVRVAFEVVQVFDHSIICGSRPEDQQTAAYNAGNSKTPWPKSKHNIWEKRPLSEAIDFLPYPFNGYPEPGTEDYTKEIARWYAISAAYVAIGHTMGVDLRGGFDWDRDGIYTDQTFDDIGHVEICT